MSKTFDEGGAKGLLLANLGVSRTGCNIVFDSTLDDEKDITMPSTEEDASMMKDNDCKTSYTRIDVSSLASKLDSLLSGLGQSIHQVPLVPQLASLRQDYAVLEQEGFIEHDKPVSLQICF
jgi:condensin complex subunit 2